MINRAKAFITQGNARSVMAKKNIVESALVKGVSIAISLIIVPLTIHYINPTQYGIWLTLSSMVAWVSFFDIGFSNGLRNKFAEAKASGNSSLVRAYISTTYFYIIAIFSLLLIFFLIINQFIDWNTFLNIKNGGGGNIRLLAAIIFSYFCISFVLRVISVILTADQKPAKASIIDASGQVIAFIAIFILTKTTEGSLIKVALAFCVSPLLLYSLFTIKYFSRDYKNYVPSFKLVKKEYAKDIMGLGVKFFVIQIAGIIQYQTALFLIAKYFGMTEVTSYNIAFKYFGVLSMIFAILLTPFWSAVTDAYVKGDMEWIKNAKAKYIRFFFLFALGGAIMLLFSQIIYHLWLRDMVSISYTLSFWMLLFVLANMYSSVHVFALNGMGIVKLQFYICMVSPVIFIFSTIFFVKYMHYGVVAIIISSIIANFNGLIIAPLQFKSIMKGVKGKCLKSVVSR
jgi:O-antigen/teichoic acid export membrane protein